MKLQSLFIASALSVLAGIAQAEDRPLFQTDIDTACTDTSSSQGIRACRHAILNEANILRMTIRDKLAASSVDPYFLEGFTARCPEDLQLIPFPHDAASLQKDVARVSFCTMAAQDVVRNFPQAVSIPQKDIIGFREAVKRAGEQAGSFTL